MHQIQVKFISKPSFIETSSLFLKDSNLSINHDANSTHYNQQSIIQHLKNDRLFRLTQKKTFKEINSQQDQSKCNWISLIQFQQENKENQEKSKDLFDNSSININSKNIKKKQFLSLYSNEKKQLNKLHDQNKICTSTCQNKKLLLQKLRQKLKKRSSLINLMKQRDNNNQKYIPLINIQKNYLRNKLQTTLQKKKSFFNQHKQLCFIQKMQNTKLFKPQQDFKSKLNFFKLPITSVYRDQIYEQEFNKLYLNKKYQFQNMNKSLQKLKDSKYRFFNSPKNLKKNASDAFKKSIKSMLNNLNSELRVSIKQKQKKLQQKLSKRLQNTKQRISQYEQQKQKEQSKIPEIFLNTLTFPFSKSLRKIR